MRLMSFRMTKEQFRDRTKTVTRRQGWEDLEPGQLLMGVEQAQGLKKGETVVRMGPIRVVDVRREPINAIDQADCIAEGFPELTPEEFTAMYCKANKVQPGDLCTRIEFGYVDQGGEGTPTAGIDLETVNESYGPGGGDGPTEGWWARGHHDPQVFIEAIQGAVAYDRLVEEWRVVPTPAMVGYCYQRFIPWGAGEPGGYLDFCYKPKRGAYPITILTHSQVAAYLNKQKAEAANDA